MGDEESEVRRTIMLSAGAISSLTKDLLLDSQTW